MGNRLASAGPVATELGSPPTNGGEEVIDRSQPYVATISFEGSADILFHRWNVEEVDAKAKAAKGSKSKKTDNVESYIYRNDSGEICIPGEYFRMSLIGAAKFRQDPRSPRKSAMDLYKAGVVSLTGLASFGKSNWDFEDRRRVVIQRNGITRTRPALKAGWKASCDFMVSLPEYITPQEFHDTFNSAGRLIGVGDFRPTFGRYMITKFDIGFEK